MESKDNQKQAAELKEVDFAWAAGFFDGEGCVTINSSPPSYRLFLKLTQVDPMSLYKLQGIFGGPIYKTVRNRQRSTGTIVTETYWDWNIVSDKAKYALEKMLPYLSLKRERALLGIEYQDYLSSRRGRSYRLTEEDKKIRREYKAKMSLLNTPPTAAERAAAETKSSGPERVCDSPISIQ